ncbi:MAG: LemA family protein [Planctomycetota bacterium]
MGSLSLLFLWLAMRALRRRRLVDDLPTSKTAGVFIGLVECSGTAESEAPFTGFLSERRCVYHRWSVEEHWSRTVTTTTTNSKGQVQVQTRTESGTTTVAKGGDSAPFWLQDETGVVQVDPEGADLKLETTFQETCGRSDPLYYAKAPAKSVADSDHRRTFTESAIPLHHPLYVIGRSRLREDAVAPMIAADKEAPLFVISTRGEASVAKGYGWAIKGYTFLAFLFGATATIGLLLALAADGPKAGELGELVTPTVVAVFATAFLALWTGTWIWTVSNALVALRERARRGDTLVDIELERRAKLIPNLVETVKATAGHERETQAALALMRAQAQSATDPSHSAARGLAPTLRALVERYPTLTADTHFADLQSRLVDTEDRIARARAYANELGANYNTRIEQVPDRWIAVLTHQAPRPMFEVDSFERRAIEVHLER